MEGLLEFAQGPLFRLTFAIMALGLLRILVLDIVGMVEAYRHAGDKVIPWKYAIGRTMTWLFPVRSTFTRRPVYSVFSILFHIGLILVPLFLFAHVALWKGALGFGWITLSKQLADILTLTTIAFGILLVIGRAIVTESRFISRVQDFMWPPLLLLPFVTGYFCANVGLSAGMYKTLMLTHILSAELIFVLLPFTKIAHCVLMPLSQFVLAIAWKFPAHAEEPVTRTLGKKGAPV